MSDPLDPRQIVRIEAVHRGFLYQHLYAAGCLLVAGPAGVRSVTVELDEDIELEMASGDRFYIQVKTRSSPLIASDIAGALARFDAIRVEHQMGRRPGMPSFVIVANVPPGPELRDVVEVGGFPADVCLLWAGGKGPVPRCLPPAWPNLTGATAWCAERARALPMAMLEPETLVWKLAGRVLLASTGAAGGHSFAAAELPELFEQLVVQLQQFPAPPEVYRPQEGEPALDGASRVRIISGFSGAGKTAWAAQAASYVGSECAYYDVGDVPGPAIAASMVRELAAQWADRTAGALRQVLLPGATGIETLRALDSFLSSSGSQAIVVLDNAHRVSAADLRMLIEATRHLKFVLLAQPSASISELEATIGIPQETLDGWSLDQTAAEVHSQGARASAGDLRRLLALTSGLPLYVRTAAQLSTARYGGNVAALCAALESQTNLVATAQELILSRLFDALPELVRDCAAVLSLSDVPLTESEAARLVKETLGHEAVAFTAAVRQLRPLGVVRIFGGQRLQIHDALRVLGLGRFKAFSASQVNAGRQALKEVILKSFESRRETSRFPLYIRTLVELGELKPLIALATEEWFHELGIASGIWEALDSAATNEDIDAEQRFYALDGLVFAEMKSGGDPLRIRTLLQAMESLVARHALGDHERLVYLLKTMVFESDRGNKAQTMQAMQDGRKLLPDKPEHQRVFRYNSALALFKLKQHGEAERMAMQLVEDYYGVIGLTPADIIGLSNKRIAERLKPSASLHDDLKHLADALDLCARAVNVQGRDSGLARVHAAKFYGLAHAIDSLVKVSQDLVDEFIGRSDYVGARQVIEENLLPVVVGYKMVDKMVGVRGQYAVVLGYCGEYNAADAEFAQLEHYRPGLTVLQRAEIDNQRDLVGQLRELGVRPGMLNLSPSYLRPERKPKIGRNAFCPCGSGRKYKHCHG